MGRLQVKVDGRFLAKSHITIKRNDRISGKPELTQVTSIGFRRLLFKRDENISPIHGTGQSEDFVCA
jgi:hypothetical protein